MNDQQRELLIDAALAARENAYAPYSRFQVGAAVMTKSGKLFTGCNVENAAYGLTLCAERVAISSAVADGERQFVGLAIAAPGGAAPCGACRQFAAEFGAVLPVLMVDAERPTLVQESSIDVLIPHRFCLREQRPN
jgi:cytidine deaminase